jgi:hypothetical protein
LRQSPPKGLNPNRPPRLPLPNAVVWHFLSLFLSMLCLVQCLHPLSQSQFLVILFQVLPCSLLEVALPPFYARTTLLVAVVSVSLNA